MKILSEMPKSGQFVEIHMYKGDIWSSTYKYIDGQLHIFCDGLDKFIEVNFEFNSYVSSKYIIGLTIKE